MGGIADYTGSLVCEAPLDRAAAVVLQEREPRDMEAYLELAGCEGEERRRAESLAPRGYTAELGWYLLERR